MSDIRRVGIFGGSFNPVHLGHLRVAEEVCEELDLDRVLFIPTFIPPHKDPSRLVSFEHRYRMLHLVLEGHPKFVVSDIEARLGGLSYTVRTLVHLRSQYQNCDFYLLVGSDAFLEIDSWWHYLDLFQLSSITVMTRPGTSHEDLKKFIVEKIDSRYRWTPEGRFEHPSWHPIRPVTVTLMDISASKIRRLVAMNRSIRFLVPEVVREYIINYRLYRA
ncbi:MAG: nicotinate-nucleotide adenylyltransferase [Thermodesulforhabdaceae bacterium]|jgi:nicotinate-nucleotide adenylyltransferase